MSALDLNVDEFRSRLAQRTSFFGGSVSTRKEAAAPGWKAKPGATGSRVSPSGRQHQPAVTQGRKPGQPGLKRVRNERTDDGASVDDAAKAAEAKRKRLAYARDYGALQAGTSTSPALSSQSAPLGQAKSLPSKRPAASPARQSAAAQWLAGASPSRSSSPAIRTLMGSRSMPSSKSGRGSPALKAAQGGRKAAFGRASAKAPGRSSLSQAQRAAESLRAAVSASISTLSSGSQRSSSGTSSNDGMRTAKAQAAAAPVQQRSLPDSIRAAPQPVPRVSKPAASGPATADRKAGAVAVELDWRRELREITGYDPSRFRDEPLDDWRMEAGWRDVQAEERRSERVGAADDRREEAAEAARQAAKAAARKAARKAEQRR